MAKARRRPMIEPTFPPVTMNMAMTRVYRGIAVWMPVTVVPTSLATVAMDTFMTELSRVIRNCPAARVSRTNPVPLAGASGARVVTASASLLSPSHLRSAHTLGGQLAVARGEHGTPRCWRRWVWLGSCRMCARRSGARTTIGSVAGPDQDLHDRQEHDHAQQRPAQP